MAALFSRHPLALHTTYSELKRTALERRFVLLGSPGSVGEREVSGRRFHYRQYYDPVGKKTADYLGPVGDADAEARTAAVRALIEETKALLPELRLLSQSGYVRVDARTSAVVGSLANGGLFRSGLVLVGSHAYGVLLNELGIRAAAFATEDVDFARAERLEIATTSFAELLAASKVPLRPIPGFGRNAPPTAYKGTGRDRFRVDLLVPTRGTEIATKRVPELDAHATALPRLGYLLERPIEGAVLARDNVVAVRIPRPEAFVWHKLLVSRSRTSTSEKRAKDVDQAAVIFAALAEDAPDTLAAALAEMSRRAREGALSAGEQLRARLDKDGHRRAVELLEELSASRSRG